MTDRDVQAAEQNDRSVHAPTVPAVGVSYCGFRITLELEVKGDLTASIDVTTVTTVGIAVSVDATAIAAVSVACVHVRHERIFQ